MSETKINKGIFLKEVGIKNYRCFKDTIIKNLAIPKGKKGSGLNILIGNNNSGKTAFLNIFIKLKKDSRINDEDKYQNKDVEILIIDSSDKKIIIKNKSRSGIINFEGESKLTIDYFDIVKDNRIWKSNFNGKMDIESYYLNQNNKRDDIDHLLSSVLLEIYNNKELKEKFDEYMKRVIPDFSEWHINSSNKYGSYISYKLFNGDQLSVDFSVGGGILNLFRIVLSFVIKNKSTPKSIILIDEPEAFLHPIAQTNLLDLMLDISKQKQIIFSTHSPYMFKGAIGSGANLIIFKRDTKDNIKVKNAREEGWGIFGEYSPTWGEINWFAYDLPTVEFHNELYGYLQAKAISENEKNYYENNFDNWLADKLEIEQNKIWIKLNKNGSTENFNRTLQTYIRNAIHHPENGHNQKYLNEELKQSIIKILDYIKKNESKNNEKA